MSYAKVWVWLVLLTVVETALAWVQLSLGLTLGLLLVLSSIKAGLIAWFYMHLKTQRPQALLFILPMLFVCIGLLLAILPEGLRAYSMR